MVKILTIFSLAAAIAAGLVLASVLGLVSFLDFGEPDYDDTVKILSSPSAVERFKEQQGDAVPTNEGKVSPLVRQAEVFANVIDPPAQISDPRRGDTRTGLPERKLPGPEVSTAKFDLVGTSYSASNPSESFAYIRLPDKTYQWVQLGSEVGHLVVQEIKVGSIIYFDGRRKVEMAVEAAPDTASLLEAGGVHSSATASGLSDAVTHQPSSPQMNERDEQRLGELVDQLRDLQKGLRSGAADANVAPEDRAAMVNRLISEFKSSRISEEESERLGDLGKKLNGTKEGSISERRREFMRRWSPSRGIDR